MGPGLWGPRARLLHGTLLMQVQGDSLVPGDDRVHLGLREPAGASFRAFHSAAEARELRAVAGSTAGGANGRGGDQGEKRTS